MEFPLDVDVHCTDGRCGRSTHIILNPATERVTHMVVKAKRPSRVERLVPIQLVQETASEVVLLNCTREEFDKLEQFNQGDFIYTDLPQHASAPELTLLWPYVVPVKRIVDEGVRRVPPGELAVKRGAKVRATDGRVGKIDEFCIDPDTGDITHFILREGNLLGKNDITIPVSYIDRIEQNVVHLNVDKETIAEIPSIPVKRFW